MDFMRLFCIRFPILEDEKLPLERIIRVHYPEAVSSSTELKLTEKRKNHEIVTSKHPLCKRAIS